MNTKVNEIKRVDFQERKAQLERLNNEDQFAYVLKVKENIKLFLDMKYPNERLQQYMPRGVFRTLLESKWAFVDVIHTGKDCITELLRALAHPKMAEIIKEVPDLDLSLATNSLLNLVKFYEYLVDGDLSEAQLDLEFLEDFGAEDIGRILRIETDYTVKINMLQYKKQLLGENYAVVPVML